MAEAESTAENLSIILAGLSVEAGEAIKRVSILAGQLEEISLFLIMAREKEAAIISKIRYIIYRLMTLRV